MLERRQVHDDGAGDPVGAELGLSNRMEIKTVFTTYVAVIQRKNRPHTKVSPIINCRIHTPALVSGARGRRGNYQSLAWLCWLLQSSARICEVKRVEVGALRDRIICGRLRRVRFPKSGLSELSLWMEKSIG
jgi:hypothetical protein